MTDVDWYSLATLALVLGFFAFVIWVDRRR